MWVAWEVELRLGQVEGSGQRTCNEGKSVWGAGILVRSG